MYEYVTNFRITGILILYDICTYLTNFFYMHSRTYILIYSKILKGFNSKKKPQQYYTEYNLKVFLVTIIKETSYLWPYKNGLPDISRLFANHKNLCGCLLRSKTRIFVCVFVLNPTWCFVWQKKIIYSCPPY